MLTIKVRGVNQSQRKSVLLIGDSLIKDIMVNKLSSLMSINKICIPSSNTDAIKHKLQSTLNVRNYDQILIQVGTNNITDSQPDIVFNSVADLAETVVGLKPEMSLQISSIIVQRDTEVNNVTLQINDRLKDIYLLTKRLILY